MKAKFGRFIPAILASVTAFSGISCLATAFWMRNVNLLALFLLSLIWGLIFTVFLNKNKAYKPLIILGVLLLLAGRSVINSLESLLYHISYYYNMGYGIGVIYWSSTPPAPDSTLILCILAIGMVSIMLWAVLRSKNVVFAVLPGLLPLAVCFGLTDTVPDSWCLGFLMACTALNLLAHPHRWQPVVGYSRLIKTLCLPVILGILLLFSLFPKSQYHGQAKADAILNQVMTWFQDLDIPAWLQGDLIKVPVTGDLGEQVDLTKVGIKHNSRSMVMKVLYQGGNYIYLRGHAFDYYTGKSWEISSKTWQLDKFSDWGGDKDAPSEEVLVQTLQPHSVLYFSYVPGSAALNDQMILGSIPNWQNETEYSFLKAPSIQPNPQWEQTLVSQKIPDMYLQLPDSTRYAAEQILDQYIGKDLSPTTIRQQYDLALQIASYVRSSAKYDLYTHRMPDDAKDFAIWFLQESATGYCTHFATATTVLLRAANIPARYVTGYLPQVTPGQWSNVRMNDAHAWVEFYIPGAGWLPLEPTPSDLESPVPTESRPTDPTPTETDPEPTKPSEEQTDPTEDSAPTGPDLPTRPTRPDDPSESTGNPSEPTVPATTDPPRTPLIPPETLSAIRDTLLRILLILATVIGQWRLRLWLRRKILHSGKPNRQAIRRWRECKLLAYLMKTPLEPSLHELAQKARYSQHTLTAQELMDFDAYRDAALGALRHHNFALRLVYRLLLALY